MSVSSNSALAGLVHLRTIALRRPQTRVRSLSSVTGNSLKQGICASRPVGPLSASDPSRAQNPQMHQNPVEDAKAGDGAARQWLALYLCWTPQMAAPTPFELEIEAAAGSEDDEFEKAVLFRKLR